MPLMPVKASISFGSRSVVATPPRATSTPSNAGRERLVAERLRAHRLVAAVGNGGAEIFMAPEFLTPEGCARLIGLIDAQRRPSTVADGNGDPRFRTSETCDMDGGEAVVADVRSSICSLTGLLLSHAEPLQGQRYGVGGEFKLHGDYFRPDSDDFVKYCVEPGSLQRTWTAMIYLDRPEGGGHTVFPGLDLDVTPCAGTLLLWNNLHPDGSINDATRHHATPVTAGVKNVVTQWFRQKPWPTTAR